MQVKSIAECSKGHSAILLTFNKLPFVIKIFVLSIFEWPFYTGFTIFTVVFSFAIISPLGERKSWVLNFYYFLMSCDCHVTVSVQSLLSAVGLSAVCDCGISWSYSLTF